MTKNINIISNLKAVKIFIVIFYCVGIAGFIMPTTHALFIQLIPFALLLSVGLLVYFNEITFSKKSVLVFAFIYICSFIIEAIGVNTGIIFGQYAYGNGLGIKLFETPLIIGINWLFMIYTSAVIVNNIKANAFSKIILASGIMIIYDLTLEQMAPKLDMWHWSENVVPLQNYIAWFLLAVFFHSLLKIGRISIKNPIASLLLISQFLFFIVLLFASK